MDHVFTFTSIIRNHMNQNKDIFAAFIDFRKAFDFIDRELVFVRLLEMNINGKFYKSVKSLYSQTAACVRVNQFNTEWFHTLLGVRQAPKPGKKKKQKKK